METSSFRRGKTNKKLDWIYLIRSCV